MQSNLFSAIACLTAVATLAFIILPAAAETPTPVAAENADGFRIGPSVIHDNLAIYLIHGPSRDGAVQLTLQEALEQKRLEVRETGTVNTLEIENTGDQDVFINAGDIVKGGRQDRVLTSSLVLPPHSGAVPIASFCVEQGRWAQRSGEDPTRFSSAAMILPSRTTRRILAESQFASLPGETPPHASNQTGAAGDIAIPHVSQMQAPHAASAQMRVWNEVAAIQDKLSRSLKTPVQAARSNSSLQLSLENGDLAQAEQAYLAAFDGLGTNETDVVGYAVAINGEIASADVYASNGLFRKLWPKLLRASVAEAIGERLPITTKKPPGSDAVGTFLAAAPQAGSVRRALPANNSVDVRRSGQAIVQETRQASPSAASATSSGWTHRSYLAN